MSLPHLSLPRTCCMLRSTDTTFLGMGMWGRPNLPVTCSTLSSPPSPTFECFPTHTPLDGGQTAVFTPLSGGSAVAFHSRVISCPLPYPLWLGRPCRPPSRQQQARASFSVAVNIFCKCWGAGGEEVAAPHGTLQPFLRLSQKLLNLAQFRPFPASNSLGKNKRLQLGRLVWTGRKRQLV